jgi:phage terminase Nu1 subunit (DNA packaging protein)
LQKNENLDVTIVNSITLATILGITDRRVRQLVQEGVINAKSRGKYELVKTVQLYCNYLRQKTEVDSNKQGAKVDYETERALHEKVKREKADLQFKVMKGELHRAQDVENIMVDMITNAKTKLLGIPAKAAPMIIGYTDIPRVQSILQKAVEETLGELANYNPELFTNKSVLVDEGEEDNE